MRELVCILCPQGCRLRVDETEGDLVRGNNCLRGEKYARSEITAPTRMLTSTVRIRGAKYRCCPVKTDRALPKKLIFEALSLLDDIELASPVKKGDIVIKNILATGINFVTTRSM
jgi:CxxC motif-containing protein